MSRDLNDILEIGNADRPGAIPSETGVQYDPRVVRKYAAILYRRALWIVVLWTVLGIVIGTGGGYYAVALPGGGWHGDPYVPPFIGSVLMGMLGFLIGQRLAFWLRLQAQLALCQVQIEINTRTS